VSETLEVAATGAAADAIRAHVPALVQDGFAGKLFAKDPTLWGPDAEEEAAKRLSWVGLPRSSRPLVGEVSALRSELNDAGIDHVVLCGMGGSSLAPEVICATYGVELAVLDSSNPDQVRAALVDRLDRTVVVVSSKSGSTVETDSQKRAYEQAFTDAGIDPATRIVIVTDPGSPLDKASREAGYRVVNADPDVGGRYSALTAFGLVPSGLAGADIATLLDEAEAVSDLLADDDEGNPALRLGAAMAGTSPLRNKLVLVDQGSGLVGFADWVEQLIAESTGKRGVGIVPIDREPLGSIAAYGDDRVFVRLALSGAEKPAADADALAEEAAAAGHPVIRIEIADPIDLAAEFVRWEVATAIAGAVLAIDPFDQPNVEEAKQRTRDLLAGHGGSAAPLAPIVSDGGLTLYGDAPLRLSANGDRTLVGELRRQLDRRRPNAYLAIQAFIAPTAARDTAIASMRTTLRDATHCATTAGYGPRFLHSTGQLHKGGAPIGWFLQLTSDHPVDRPIPGWPYTFGRLIDAQAQGDFEAIESHDLPIVRVHLADPETDLRRLEAALAEALLGT
jgi:glucose-6-phosphate isomerase